MRHRPRGAVASKEKEQRLVYSPNKRSFNVKITQPKINGDTSNLLLHSPGKLFEYIGVGSKLGREIAQYSRGSFPFYCRMYYNGKNDLIIDAPPLEEW